MYNVGGNHFSSKQSLHHLHIDTNLSFYCDAKKLVENWKKQEQMRCFEALHLPQQSRHMDGNDLSEPSMSSNLPVCRKERLR